MDGAATLAADAPPKRKRGATFTGDVREMLENALHECGGRDYLVWVARRRPDVFCQLVGKIIPTEARLTVMAGYQAMPVPVEVREAIPGLIAAPETSGELTGDPSGDPLAIPSGSVDDWGL
jgi:hypothetical protein